jgi:methylthioribulose-1-phosphate dehydratase
VSDQILSQLAAEASRLSGLGFLACTAGNVSCLLGSNPFMVGMSPSGVDKGQLKSTDFIRIDGNARPMPPDQRKPSDEALLHVRIYQAVGCQAVCHGHPAHAVAMSMAAGPNLVVSGIEMQKAFAGISTHEGEQRIPIVENSQDMEELSIRVMAARHPQIPAVLVRGHGVYAWGNSVKEASRHLETVEWLARIVWLCRTAGIS